MISLYSEKKIIRSEVNQNLSIRRKEIESEQLHHRHLLEIEEKLQASIGEKKQLIAIDNKKVLEMTEQISDERNELKSNRVCLTKLQKYLECLKAENRKVNKYLCRFKVK